MPQPILMIFESFSVVGERETLDVKHPRWNLATAA